jgi:hypothetical protein
MTPDRWKQIEQIYRSALARALSQRAAFLKEARGHDEALRKQVESLLGQLEQAGSFIASPGGSG